jgi:hypothetical protein
MPTTHKRCIFCFDREETEDVIPLYAGRAPGTMPVAWVHPHCLADYGDEKMMKDFDDMNAELDPANQN